MPGLTKREANVRVFAGEEVPYVLFQPRLEPWYAWHRDVEHLPAPYAGMSLTELYDHLDVSMRYVHYYTGMPDPVQRETDAEVQVSRETDGAEATIVTRTPHGDLVERQRLTVDKTWRTVEFPVKTLADMRSLRWVLERTRLTFGAPEFERGASFVGDRGEPQFWLPKSPYQALCQQWMKLDDFIFALADAPQEVEAVMELIDRSYDLLYQQVLAYGEVRIINFGENLHEQLLSPAYLERYLIPWYEKRSGQLHEAGVHTHIHIDGYFHNMLKYLPRLPFDGVEALTPIPQGDMTLEEIRDHIGDKVLLDGIPAVLFLPTYPEDDLTECAQRLVDLFHPRLVLGVSDELPQGAGVESMARVERLSRWCAGGAG
jgi:hypothetical protein